MGLAKRILVVDDDLDILMGLQLTLEERYDVEVACHPGHALHILESEQFDVLVIDLMMPSMDGTKVIAEIRARKLSQAPILLMSAYPDAKETAALSGAADSICKPFEIELLERKLSRLLTSPVTERSSRLFAGKAL